MHSAQRRAAALVFWMLLSFAAASLGGLATSTSVGTWYGQLSKPAWTPPSWLFGPVWTLLYIGMAVSAWLVWCLAGWVSAHRAYLVQLALNAVWSIAFFGFRSPFAGMMVIVALLLAIVWTMRGFAPLSRPAAWLLLPYLAWVSFAALLNTAIWLLNL